MQEECSEKAILLYDVSVKGCSPYQFLSDANIVKGHLHFAVFRKILLRFIFAVPRLLLYETSYFPIFTALKNGENVIGFDILPMLSSTEEFSKRCRSL